MRPRQEHHRAPNPVPRATHLPNRERGGDLRHILDTALPPGIGEGDAIERLARPFRADLVPFDDVHVEDFFAHGITVTRDRMKPLYTAVATARGGRDGHVRSSDGILDAALKMPKELGGPGGPATNPDPETSS